MANFNKVLEFLNLRSKPWCGPAKLYFVLSSIAIVVMAFQNIGNNDLYCVGSYVCNSNSVILLFAIKVIYILFWTWILNMLCDSGLEHISWLLVLLPFILFFVFIASYMAYRIM